MDIKRFNGKFLHGIDFYPLLGEQWMPVTNYEGLYEVSNFGRIKSLPRKGSPRTTIMQTCLDSNGYEQTAITKNKKSTSFKIHKLVAIAFIEKTLTGYEINHKDGNRLNNNASNLEWCTRSENVKHSYDFGIKCHKGDRQGTRKLCSDQVREITAKYKPRIYTRTMLAKEYGVTISCIKQVLNKKNWASIW